MGLDWPAVWSFLPSKDGMRSVSQEAGFSDLRGSAELFQYKSGDLTCLAFPSGGSGLPIAHHVPCFPPLFHARVSRPQGGHPDNSM